MIEFFYYLASLGPVAAAWISASRCKIAVCELDGGSIGGAL